MSPRKHILEEMVLHGSWTFCLIHLRQMSWRLPITGFIAEEADWLFKLCLNSLCLGCQDHTTLGWANLPGWQTTRREPYCLGHRLHPRHRKEARVPPPRSGRPPEPHYPMLFVDLETRKLALTRFWHQVLKWLILSFPSALTKGACSWNSFLDSSGSRLII